MIKIYLTSVLATHMFIHGQGTKLLKVCEYRAPLEVSWTYYHYPITRYIDWDSECANYVEVEK